jgi:hypothetical protein
MGDPVPDLAAQLLNDSAFICDLARYQEQLVTKRFIRKKYSNLDEAAWTQLAKSEELISAIELESARRVSDGSSMREKARLRVVRAPDVAASIMDDREANARHRLDAVKILDDLAGGPQAVPPMDRFQIVINLGTDTETYDKPIEINPATPDDSKVVVAIPAKKSKRKKDDEQSVR